MSASGNHALPGDWHSAFRQAHLALDAGDGEAARELAHAVLRTAQERQNPHAEARALACLAHNYLGAVYFWSRSFGEAQAAFEASASLAAACVPPVCPLQPLTNLVFLDALHLVTSRFHQGTPSSTTRMQVGLETCLRNAETWGYEGLAPGTTVTGRALVQFLQSLCNCWLGDLQQAAQDLEAGQLWA